MYPSIELRGVNISMMAIGIAISFLIFIFTARILTQRNGQDFLKLFYRIPGRIILSYTIGRYISFFLETWTYIPTSFSELLTILSPNNFNIHFVWILLSSRICIWSFFSGIKRTENKKIRADILFISLANAIIILWIFLSLWDTMIWNPTDSIFAIRALTDESALTKFDWVYPVGLFISCGILAIHILVSIPRIIFKKNWLWIRWLIGILIVLNIAFFFQSYPRHWVISIFSLLFDIKQYISLIVIIHCSITAIKWKHWKF